MSSVRRILACATLCVALSPAAALAGTPHTIVGGQITPLRPFVGFLVSGIAPDFDTYRLCAAVPVRPNVVLTAAHCVVDAANAPDQTGRAGVTWGQSDPWQALQDKAAVGISGKTAVILNSFKDFGDESGVDDLALMSLRERIPAPSVHLLSPRYARSAKAGTAATLFGYGSFSALPPVSPSPLRRATLTLQSPKACAAHWSHYKSSMLCATGRTQSPCFGDDGDPLFVTGPGGSAVLAGIFSSAKSCTPGVQTIFTSVATEPIATWIRINATALQKQADAAGAATPQQRR